MIKNESDRISDRHSVKWHHSVLEKFEKDE